MSKNKGPRTSVIAHPADIPMRITREDYLVICCGNDCAADLLNVFEHWANAKGIEEWIYRSVEGLREDLVYQHSDKSIRDAIKSLMGWGYIERRNNPRMGQDRKYQYRLIVDSVHEAIWYFYRMDAVNLPNALGKNTETIKETLKETQEESSPTPPSGESDSAISVNGKKPKTGRTKEDLDALYNMICKGSFNKDHSEIDKPQRGRVLAIRKALLKAMPDVTAEELKQAYVLYALKNPEALEDATRRLKSETKVPDWLQMAIDEGMVPTRQVTADPRASQKWQANAEIYRAYADAFSDRWSDAEILAQDFSGIEAWWYHTGQYEQGDGE